MVQFSTSDEELVERAGSHIAGALGSGAIALVLAAPPRARAFAAWLTAADVELEAAVADGTYVALDAHEMLQRLLVDGEPDAGRFDDSIGTLVRAAAATGRPVCAYGEMVALLWDEGRVNAAIKLEELWNELSARTPFSLFCSYPSTAVTSEDHAGLVSRVCCLHTAVIGPDPRDRAIRRFEAAPDAPRAARAFVTDTLRRLGSEHLIADAALVVTELATNAVVHAGCDFTVTIAPSCDAVRIEVRDGSALPPKLRPARPRAESGRGLALIAAVAGAWGVDRASDGKIIWAELSPLAPAWRDPSGREQGPRATGDRARRA